MDEDAPLLCGRVTKQRYCHRKKRAVMKRLQREKGKRAFHNGFVIFFGTFSKKVPQKHLYLGVRTGGACVEGMMDARTEGLCA